jgi:hypothetical protein
MNRLTRSFHAGLTVCFGLVTFATAAPGPSPEKTRLLEDYYRLVDSAPETARATRDRYMEIVNLDAKDPFFSYVLGSQWPGSLDETKHPARKGLFPERQACEVMLSTGSDILKIGPNRKSLVQQGVPNPGEDRLDLLVRHPFYERILDRPYRVMLFWAHGGRDSRWHGRTVAQTEKDALYRELYELTRHLLTRYAGSGKTFLIGNWEGDWMAGGYDVAEKIDIPQERLDAFAEWLDTRTRAIDDAKAATPHTGVAVYSYLEINHTRAARDKGLKRLVNTVLPRSRVDFVSISAYDFQGFHSWPAPRTADSLRPEVFANLDYVQSLLPPRDVPGKRVFIGEIGYTWEEIAAKDRISLEEAKREQARLALIQARVNLEWGVPLWLWWATFSSHEGTFGLVDNHTNAPSPLHGALTDYFSWSRGAVATQRKLTGLAPDTQQFREAAIRQLDLQIGTLEKSRASP